MNTNLLFVLGATDPEMVEIKTIIDQYDQEHIQLNCNPRTAYTQKEIIDNIILENKGSKSVILVECGNSLPHVHIDCEKVIDHHHPSHLTVNYPKEHYFRASSIGQVCELLGHTPTKRQILAGLCDHNLGEFYKNPEYWGFKKEQILAFRRECIMEETKSDNNTVFRIWQTVSERFANKNGFVDLTEYGQIGNGYDSEYLLHVEYANANGIAFKMLTKDVGDDRLKLVVGNCSEKQVINFMEENKNALEGSYGVPSRGFAGGYYPT